MPGTVVEGRKANKMGMHMSIVEHVHCSMQPLFRGTASISRAPNCLRYRNVCQPRRTNSLRRSFCATFHPRKLPPTDPLDATNADGVDLDEFIGSPGWNLEDLLPPTKENASQTAESITPQTLHHLLQLSGLPQPESPEEESKLVSALHDQLHFVRHVQSVPTENVEPLIRVGNERGGESGESLTFEECMDEARSEEIPGLEWKQWDVCGIKGGSREGRDQGWFIVNDKLASEEEE